MTAPQVKPAGLVPWPAVIAEIKAAGLTYVDIAEACGITRQTVAALAKGETDDPVFSRGTLILELLERVRNPKAKENLRDQLLAKASARFSTLVSPLTPGG